MATPYQTNPYLDQMVQRAQDSVKSNMNTAMANSGSFGNSGVQQATALGLSDVATNMYGNDYQNAMNRDLQRYGMDQSYNLGLGNLGLGFQNSNQNFALGMGNLGLGYQNSNQNFYTAQRGQDLQQTALGANLFQQGNQGYLSQGQGIYNLGLSAQQAPWQAVDNFNSASKPYTGFGTTTGNTSGSPAAGFLGGALGAGQLYNIWK